MFWPEPFDADAVSGACQAEWGVTPRRLWATQQWGGRRCAACSPAIQNQFETPAMAATEMLVC